MAKESRTGERALYKLELSVSGFGAAKYKFTTGYLPASAVDALSGKLKEPKDLYSLKPRSEAQARHLNGIFEEFGKRLEELSRSPSRGDPDEIRNLITFYGGLYAAAALADSDLISIGQTGSNDPYAYRKLVFFVSTEVINIKRFESEVEALERTAVDLADSIRQVRQARAAATQAKAERIKGTRQAMLGFLQSKPDMTQWTGLNFLELFAIAKGVTP